MGGRANKALGAYAGAKLRVEMMHAQRSSGCWSYRRAGFAFSKDPVELTIDQLGTCLADAIETMLLLATDGGAYLNVRLIGQDGSERVLNDGAGSPSEAEISRLRADLVNARSMPIRESMKNP